MRVLVISSALPPTRIAEADLTLHLCRRLAEQGLDVHLLTSRGQSAAPPCPFAIHPVMRRWSWRDLPRAAWQIRRLGPEAILLVYLGALYGHHPMVTYLPTVARSFAPSARFVTQATNVWGSRPHRDSAARRLIHRSVARWAGGRALDRHFGALLRDSHCLVAMSESHRDWLTALCPGVQHRSLVIPPPPLLPITPEAGGVARRKGREALGVGGDELLVAYFGRIYPSKGIDTLLYAFHLASQRVAGLRMVLIGGGASHGFSGPVSHESQLQNLAARLGLAPRIAWTGELAWDSVEASTYLRAADLCVLPFQNGVDLNNSSFATAAAHALPIVSTEAASLARAFVHRENVFLCPPQNARAMASAIEEVAGDAELRQRLGRGAFQMSERWFNWERAIRQTVEGLRGAPDLPPR